MKTIITFAFCLFAFTNYAQLSEAQLNRYTFQVDSAASLLHQSLYADGESEFSTVFRVDTFKIERMLSLKLRNDTSKAEQINALNDAEIAYDFLVSKYYKFLLNLYNAEDQKVIIANQKKWVKYRDEQIALFEKNKNQQVKGNEKDIFAAEKNHLKVSKVRAVELFNQILASPFFEK